MSFARAGADSGKSKGTLRGSKNGRRTINVLFFFYRFQSQALCSLIPLGSKQKVWNVSSKKKYHRSARLLLFQMADETFYFRYFLYGRRETEISLLVERERASRLFIPFCLSVLYFSQREWASPARRTVQLNIPYSALVLVDLCSRKNSAYPVISKLSPLFLCFCSSWAPRGFWAEPARC